MTPHGCFDAIGFVMEPQLPRTRLICTLTGTTVEAMIDQALQSAETGCDTVELRLDYLRPTPDPNEVAAIVDACGLDVIATCRPAREGGKFTGVESDRLAILQAASDAGAIYIDVEADVPPERRPEGTVISSRHDFETCPTTTQNTASSVSAIPYPTSPAAAAENAISMSPSASNFPRPRSPRSDRPEYAS